MSSFLVAAAAVIVMTKYVVRKAILMLGLLVVVVNLSPMALAQDNASAAIASARQQLVTCFDSAKQAESAGANVSSLTSVLNEAGDLLSQAELAYSQGDNEGAQSFALQCSQTLVNLVAEADELRATALQQKDSEFWTNTVSSAVGACIVVAAGLISWLALKNRYKPLETEPEMHTNEPARD